MLKVWRAFFAHRNHDERGASEFASALMVFPVLFMLIIGSVEIGMYVQTRMRVENIARDAVRQVAADGGNYNPRTVRSGAIAVDKEYYKWLVEGNKCKLSKCSKQEGHAALPTINCKHVLTAKGESQYPKSIVDNAGDTVICKVWYPYEPIAGGLMKGPLGLGIGSILQPFPVEESARAETGGN